MGYLYQPDPVVRADQDQNHLHWNKVYTKHNNSVLLNLAWRTLKVSYGVIVVDKCKTSIKNATIKCESHLEMQMFLFGMQYFRLVYVKLLIDILSNTCITIQWLHYSKYISYIFQEVYFTIFWRKMWDFKIHSKKFFSTVINLIMTYPALLLTTVKLFTLDATKPEIKFSGIPHKPKPTK